MKKENKFLKEEKEELRHPSDEMLFRAQYGIFRCPYLTCYYGQTAVKKARDNIVLQNV